MSFLVLGSGDHSKSPARFADVTQACDYAAGLARAGISADVYQMVTSFSADAATVSES